MKIKFLLFAVAILTLSSIHAQNRQDRDPNKNEDLYLIPEIRIGYGFLDTNNPMIKATGTSIKSTYDNYTPMSYSAFLNFGYHFTPLYSAGIGVGVMQYSDPKSTSLPTYVDLRGYLYDTKNTPFAFAKVGVCLQWWKAFTPGSWTTLGVGYKFFSGKQCFTASLGYEFKHITPWNDLTTEEGHIGEYSLNRHSLTFTFGVVL
ncbi:MAG: hypothetical protein H6Q17_987 [Bacteroidetes bacterium]|nr:hypothetical protein [Bacteroidota bacterium]